MPSVSKVEVIGEKQEDYAVNVFFEDRNEAVWFARPLLEFVDHAPGTEIRLDGVPKKWERTAGGEWIESSVEDLRAKKRPWWRFW